MRRTDELPFIQRKDELLNGGISDMILEARGIMERWRKTNNTIRSHSSLGYRPPAPEVHNPLSLPMAHKLTGFEFAPKQGAVQWFSYPTCIASR